MVKIGTMFAMGNVQSLYFAPFGIDPHDISIFLLIVLFGGILGSVAAGWLVQKTKAYKAVLMICCVASSITIFVQTGLMWHWAND